MLRRPMVIALALGLSGCAHIAQKMGVAGWFTVDEAPSVPYLKRFTPVALEWAPCPEVKRLTPGNLVVVMVHGVKGDGDEWLEPLQVFPRLPPHALLMYRWVPWHARNAIAAGLAEGVNRLTRCLADRPGLKVLVLGHSAGGVVSAYAAQWFQSAAPGVVTVVTVAAPLSGSNRRERNEGDREEAVFMLDLGSGITTYPAAAPGVAVYHLRTSATSDPVMEPDDSGHIANAPKVGVPGATVIDLPDDLTHDGSLAWVVNRLVEAGGDPAQAKWGAPRSAE